MFSTEKINIKNAIINSQRVNQELYMDKMPLRLKAGMIGKISVKVSIFKYYQSILNNLFSMIQTSLLNLFSESVHIQLSDMHMVFGPSKDFMSKDEDFSDDPKGCFYDFNDQIQNIVMMHQIVDETRKEERKIQSKIKQEKKLKRKALRAKKRQQIAQKYREKMIRK